MGLKHHQTGVAGFCIRFVLDIDDYTVDGGDDRFGSNSFLLPIANAKKKVLLLSGVSAFFMFKSTQMLSGQNFRTNLIY